jgi:hypothetical protein
VSCDEETMKRLSPTWKPLAILSSIAIGTGCGGRLLVDTDSPGTRDGGAVESGGAAPAGGSGGATSDGSGGAKTGGVGGIRGSAEAGGASGSGGLVSAGGAAGSGGLVDGGKATGGSGGFAGAGGNGPGGAASGGAATGGVDSGASGAVGSGGFVDAGLGSGGGGTVTPCSADTDCPHAAVACTYPKCVLGRCEIQYGAPGSQIWNWPGDCHASLCDGSGNVTSVVVDQTNVPVPDNPCVAGTCTASGATGTVPLAVGTPCSTSNGGKLCDGAGACVQCLHTADCSSGHWCTVQHACGTVACTDTDCGGPCPPCGLGKHCLVDYDCLSDACDAATLTCSDNQCTDRRQDGAETDADCGGGTCPACGIGKSCLAITDCASQACDAISLTCIWSQCADHRMDGQEPDIDCGGINCNPCNAGQHCFSSFDCLSGHFCNASKVCQ